MLTVPQAGVLELLEELECLRRRQVEQYAAARYGSRPKHVGHMLRQLAMLGKVRLDGELVLLEGRKPDFSMIRAFDVALALTGGRIDFAAKGGKGITLVFSAQGRMFGVVMVGEGMEYIVPMRVRADADALTVIFLLRDAEQRKCIRAPGNCYFAVEDNEGYHFFK
jgi:hypothetical protein